MDTNGAVEDIDDATRTAILRTLHRHPYDVWTRESLARRLGMPSSLVGTVLAQLAGTGVIVKLDGPDEEYTVVGEY